MNRAVKLIAVTIAFALPGAARAGYVSTGIEPIPGGLSPISGAVISTHKGGSPDQTVTLPFPFKFYDKTYNTVRVGYRGYMAFDAAPTTTIPFGIPSKNTPYAIIAPWWGNWGADVGSVSYRIEGTAPNRVFIVQWRNAYYTSDPKTSQNGATFQARLIEDGYKIQFAYGTSALGNYGTQSSIKAAVGIQNTGGLEGTQGLGCTGPSSATCGSANFPENSTITFVQPSDLTLTRVYADETGYAGVPMRMGATVLNQGGDEARGATVGFYLSNDAVYDVNDQLLNTSAPVDIANGQKRDVMIAPILPSNLAAGTYYIFARADPFNYLNEDNENNNLAPVGGLRFSVGVQTPDLTLGPISIPATSTAGSTVKVTRTIRNIGNLLVGACAVDADCGTGICNAGRCRAACSEPSDCTAPLTCDVEHGICEKPACTIDSDCGGNEACSAGTCVAKKITYSIYLSENSVISLADQKLNAAPLELAGGIPAFGESAGEDDVTLPSDLGPGQYYIGVLVDPENDLREISEVNNAGASSQPLTLVTDSVSVVTTTLPDASVQAPYGVRLKAAGGTGSYTFSVSSGNLPSGITLSPNGDLSGVPAQTGTYAFRVQVQSGAATANADLSIKVNAAVVPLTLLTSQIPAAEFGVSYVLKLAAVGGVAPYRWSLSGGTLLPPGLAMAEDGTIEGIPQADGVFAFEVEVEDSAGTRQAGPLTLQVASPDRMRIATTNLPAATLGKPYEAVLSAVGGRAPYAWTIEESRLLPLGATDSAAPATKEPPAGLAITTRDGLVVLSGTPTYAGTWALTLKALDAAGKSDVASFVLPVRPVDSLTIATRALPDAIIGKPYAAQLHADGSQGAVVWSLTCTPAKDSTTGEILPCPQTMPAIFNLTPEGLITTGEAAVEAPEANADGTVPERATHRFMVKAQDESGRTAISALSVTVRAEAKQEAPPPESTCQTGFGPTSVPLAAFVAVFGLALLRRRRFN